MKGLSYPAAGSLFGPAQIVDTDEDESEEDEGTEGAPVEVRACAYA